VDPIADWRPTSIDGVVRHSHDAHADERGSFRELWRASLTGPLSVGEFVQANLSRSGARVLRGMHVHQRQTDLWVQLDGMAVAAVADLRPLVEGRSGAPAVELHDLVPGEALLIPPLVAHGYLARTDMSLLYLVTNEYDGTDESGFAWDDPAAAIPWPDAQPVLSDRDRSNPPLEALLATLRAGGQAAGR
jgi:dTDP-4-dehydrorhamnose 3,5-epimerase